MSESMARFESGPMDGRTVSLLGPWPLPDRLAAAAVAMLAADREAAETAGPGAYVKVSESQLPDSHPPGLIRGALYRWEPA